MTQRRGRATPLNNTEREALSEWGKHGLKQVARTLGVSVKSVQRWLEGGGVEHTDRGDRIRAALKTRARTPPLPTTGAADPELLVQRYEAAVKQHFQEFKTASAIHSLRAIVREPLWTELEILDFLERMLVVLAIYRQSIDVFDSDFLEIARCCIMRLKRETGSWSHELAARVACLAWEFVAVAVQRGHANRGIKALTRIDNAIASQNLKDSLPFNRHRIMQRMQYWGHVVASPDLAHARRFRSEKAPVKVAIPEPAVNLPAESLHRNLLSFLCDFRMALADKGELSAAEAAFAKYVFPTVRDVSDMISRGDIGTLQRVATPANALSAAFHSVVYADVVNTSESDNIRHHASRIFKWVQRQTGSSVTLQHANTETKDIVCPRSSEGLAPRFRAVLGDVDFVNDIYARTSHDLIRIADQLLECIRMKRFVTPSFPIVLHR